MKLVIALLLAAIPFATQADEVLQIFNGRDSHTTRPFQAEGLWEIPFETFWKRRISLTINDIRSADEAFFAR
jgi:hypothetical protein